MGIINTLDSTSFGTFVRTVLGEFVGTLVHHHSSIWHNLVGSGEEKEMSDCSALAQGDCRPRSPFCNSVF